MKNLLTVMNELNDEYNEGKLKIDCLDIGIDSLDSIYPTFVFPDKEKLFTDYALRKYKDVLNLPVGSIERNNEKNYSNYITIHDPEDDNIDIEKMSDKLERFLYDCAGYCSCSEYDKLFGLGDYESGDIFDCWDVYLKYGVLFDSDFMGSNYDKIKDLYDRDATEDEFYEAMGMKD